MTAIDIQGQHTATLAGGLSNMEQGVLAGDIILHPAFS